MRLAIKIVWRLSIVVIDQSSMVDCEVDQLLLPIVINDHSREVEVNFFLKVMTFNNKKKPYFKLKRLIF